LVFGHRKTPSPCRKNGSNRIGFLDPYQALARLPAPRSGGQALEISRHGPGVGECAQGVPAVKPRAIIVASVQQLAVAPSALPALWM